jgi:hypothetical protein
MRKSALLLALMCGLPAILAGCGTPATEGFTMTEELPDGARLHRTEVSDSVDAFNDLVTTDFTPETVMFQQQTYELGGRTAPGSSPVRFVAVLTFGQDDLAKIRQLASTDGAEVRTWPVPRHEEWFPPAVKAIIPSGSIYPQFNEGSDAIIFNPDGIFTFSPDRQGYYFITDDDQIYLEFSAA